MLWPPGTRPWLPHQRAPPLARPRRGPPGAEPHTPAALPGRRTGSLRERERQTEPPLPLERQTGSRQPGAGRTFQTARAKQQSNEHIGRPAPAVQGDSQMRRRVVGEAAAGYGFAIAERTTRPPVLTAAKRTSRISAGRGPKTVGWASLRMRKACRRGGPQGARAVSAAPLRACAARKAAGPCLSPRPRTQQQRTSHDCPALAPGKAAGNAGAPLDD